MWTPTFENGILVKQSHCQINLSLQKINKNSTTTKTDIGHYIWDSFCVRYFSPKRDYPNVVNFNVIWTASLQHPSTP